MTPPSTLYHSYLRPSVLQILRATGYQTTRPAVLDSLTDLAARYLAALCEKTARHAAHNSSDENPEPSVVDVRMALQDLGAVLPERPAQEQLFAGVEDTRGVDDFISWFASARNRQIMELTRGDGEAEAGDYLTALKKKHNKTAEDSKYHGTIFGKATDHGEILVEGGEQGSIQEWARILHGPPTPEPRPGSSASSSRPPSSGLSSVGDRLDDDMDLS